MPLVVTKPCKIYYGYQIHELAEGTVVPDGDFANYLRTAGGAPVAEHMDTMPGVPDGSANDVLAWVGDDPARAALAVEAEQKRDKPRSTLVAALEKIPALVGQS